MDSNPSKTRLFHVGSEVEVRSNEEGFVGGWFEATVTRSHPKYRRYTVTYSALLADEKSTDPLQETVHRSYIRPQPPRSEPSTAFGLHQPVEAYHNDGWWKGVVVKLPGGGNSLYSVCFPATREEFQFKVSEIRRHREWARGKWVDVKPQEGIDLVFGVGTQIEVSRDKENFGAAWFVGTVLKIIGKRSFLVEYENLRVNGNDGTRMLLKEIVDLQYIRPCPPTSESTAFVLLGEVEGFHMDGWFAGVVLEILPGCRYIIEYKHEKKAMVLDHNSVRSRLVWTNSSWIDISQDNHDKTRTPRSSKSSVRSSKSSFGKKSSSPISVSRPREGDDGSDRLKKLKKVEKKHTSTGQSKLSEIHKESNRSGLFKQLQLASGLSQDESNKPPTSSAIKLAGNKRKFVSGKRSHPSISLSSFSPSDEVILKNMKKVSGPCLEDGVEISQPFKKLKLERKMLEPSFADKDRPTFSSQPSKKSKKVKTLEEHLQLADGSTSMAACGSETSKRSSSAIKNSPSFKMGPKSQVNPLPRELNQGKTATSGVKDSNKSIIHGKGSSSCLSEGVETNQSKESILCHSSVRHDASDDELIANLGNCKVNHSQTSNTKMHRKKLVSRSLYKPRKTSNNPVKELKELEGGKPPMKKHCCENGGMESEKLENGMESVVGGENRPDLVDLSNQTPNADVSTNVLPCYHQEKTKGEKSGLIANTEGVSAATDVINNYLNNLDDVQECSHVTPQMESSTIGANFLKYSKCQKSPILKFLNSRFEEKWICPSEHVKNVDDAATIILLSKEHNIHDHDEVNQNMSPSDKVVEMDQIPISTTNTKSSSVSNNVYDHNEFTPSKSLFEKAIAEIRDGAHIDPSPCRSSISREYNVAVHNEVILSGSLFGRTLVEIEKEKIPIDSTPSGSSPSKKEIGHCNELVSSALSSGVSHSSISRIEEIQSNAHELVVTATGEREKQALPSLFKQHIVQQSDEFALTVPSSARDINMDNGDEMAVIGPSLQASSNEEIVLPFTRKSKMWELVESGEVFQRLPQKPHFYPLLRVAQELREGIAIGLLVSFESLVTETSSLCIADSQESFEQKLIALDHLEANGFNVQSVRIRLGRLLETHNKRSQSEGEKLYLNAKVLELEEENERKSCLVSSIEKAISELERNLTILQEKRATMDLEMRKSDSEIVSLRTGVQAAEEASISAESQFKAALSAPW